MKTKIVAGRVVVEFNYEREDTPYDPKRIGQICKRGSRLFIYEIADDEVATNKVEDILSWANVWVGPKTLVRMLESALAGELVNETVGTAYGESYRDATGDLQADKKGRYILFTAPCGATGKMTVREAEKLVEAVKSL